MRIFPTRIYKSSGRLGGFTFIEVMIVIFLLSLAMFLTVPTFQSLLQGVVEKEAKRLIGVVRLLRNEAVLSRKPFRLMIDIKEGKYSVEEKTDFGNYIPRSQPKILLPHKFPTSFLIEDIIVFGHRYDRMNKKPVPIHIDTSGFIDPFLIHFIDDEKPWTIKAKGFTAKMSLIEGHVEMDDEDE